MNSKSRLPLAQMNIKKMHQNNVKSSNSKDQNINNALSNNNFSKGNLNSNFNSTTMDLDENYIHNIKAVSAAGTKVNDDSSNVGDQEYIKCLQKALKVAIDENEEVS